MWEQGWTQAGVYKGTLPATQKETPSRSETEGNQTQGLERDTSPSIRISGRETTSHWKKTVVYPGGGRLLWAIIG